MCLAAEAEGEAPHPINYKDLTKEVLRCKGSEDRAALLPSDLVKHLSEAIHIPDD
jgi:hypothetical protein